MVCYKCLLVTAAMKLKMLTPWNRVFVMTSAFPWQNSISLCPGSLHIPRPNLPVTPGVS